MKIHVIRPFGKYQAGDQISDSEEVKSILKSEQSAFVVKVRADEVRKSKKPQTTE
jgi:hypothetical protein